MSLIQGFVNWIFSLYSPNNNSNNNSNSSISITRQYTKYETNFKSISFVHDYVGSFLGDADFLRYTEVFRSKDIRKTLYKMKTKLLIPFYDVLSELPYTFSRYI